MPRVKFQPTDVIVRFRDHVTHSDADGSTARQLQQVTVQIDGDALVALLWPKARRSKTGRSRICGGAVRCTVTPAPRQ